MVSAGLSLLFLLGGGLLLWRHRSKKQSPGAESVCLDRARIREDLLASFLRILSYTLLGLGVLGFFLLKSPEIFLAVSGTAILLVAGCHGENLLNAAAVRSGRFSLRRKRAKVRAEWRSDGHGGGHVIHRVSFGTGGELNTIVVEDDPDRGLLFFKPGERCLLVVVNGRIARVYPEKGCRLGPDLPEE